MTVTVTLRRSGFRRGLGRRGGSSRNVNTLPGFGKIYSTSRYLGARRKGGGRDSSCKVTQTLPEFSVRCQLERRRPHCENLAPPPAALPGAVDRPGGENKKCSPPHPPDSLAPEKVETPMVSRSVKSS